MSSKEFWKLSWYEWSGWALRIQYLREQRKEDQELQMELTRQIMTLTANIHRDKKKKPTPFIGSDFFNLSYDKKIEAKDQVDFADVVRRFGSKLKRNGK